MSELKFTDAEKAAFRTEYAKGATDTQFELFISDCERREVIPGKHVVFQIRTSSEYDPVTKAYVKVPRPVFITTISALRLIADRTKLLSGQGRDRFVYLDDDGIPSIFSEIPLPNKALYAVEATIYRRDFVVPSVGVARWEAYAQTNSSGNLTSTWATRGPEQLAKCAAAAALRAAFPEEVGALYIAEELKNEDTASPTPPTPAVVASAPATPVVPAVSQTPVDGVEGKKPDEARPRRRKAREEVVPQPKPPVEEGLTEEDLNVLGTPEPPSTRDPETAAAFVESLDPTPTKQELAEFVVRLRAITKKDSSLGEKIKADLLEKSKVDDPKNATVRVWNEVLTFFEQEKQ
jgi:hypothetical protein